MVRDKFLIAAVIGFMTLLASSHVFAQAEVIEKRQDAMKGNSANAKAIKAAVESKDYATIETKAKDIMGTAEKIPGLFPKGSTTGKTKATLLSGKNPTILPKPPRISERQRASWRRRLKLKMMQRSV